MIGPISLKNLRKSIIFAKGQANSAVKDGITTSTPMLIKNPGLTSSRPSFSIFTAELETNGKPCPNALREGIFLLISGPTMTSKTTSIQLYAGAFEGSTNLSDKRTAQPKCDK
jgi:hypothetical protein